MYTRSVPCSQLRCKEVNEKAYYAECAGDLKHYRQAKVSRGSTAPMIISIYSNVFNSCQNIKYDHIGEEKTNERVSNLYLKLGGIPSYKVAITTQLIQNNEVGKLQLENTGFEQYVDAPSAQVFPRLPFARGYNQPRPFLKCIIENDGILSEVMKISQSEIQRNIAKAKTNIHDYKEVVYRIMSYIFIFNSGVREVSESESYQNFLQQVHYNLNTEIRLPSSKDSYMVCELFGKYFDQKSNPGFVEDSVKNENQLCRSIIDYDLGIIKQKLCDQSKLGAKDVCFSIYGGIPSRKRPWIDES